MPFITSLSNKLPHLKQRQGSNYLVSYSYHRAQRGREHSSLIIDCEYLRFLPSLIINCGDSKTKDEQSSDFKVVRFWYERQVYLKSKIFDVIILGAKFISKPFYDLSYVSDISRLISTPKS